MLSTSANSVVVLDFETTGLSPNMGDRAIEIGAVKLLDGMVVDTFQSLMNPGFRVSGFIESYTGITNQMLQSAPDCETVMREFSQFIGNSNLVAHNASFDKRFLDAEFEQIGVRYSNAFACSMLTARRLIPDAPSHKLGELVALKRIQNDGVFHRALADAEMTAKLWLVMIEELQHLTPTPATFAFMQRISRTSKSALHKLF